MKMTVATARLAMIFFEMIDATTVEILNAFHEKTSFFSLIS